MTQFSCHMFTYALVCVHKKVSEIDDQNRSYTGFINESMKRKLKIKPIYECRCDGRLQTKRFTRLSHTGLVVELEHLKIKTRLTNEKFASVKGGIKGECEI